MGYPRPLQERIPILVGGNGERRTLRLAARYADACNVIGEVDVVARKVAALHAHCAALDRDPAEVEVTQLSTTLVGRDAAEVAELVERLRPRKRHAERYAASVNAGTVDDQIGRFRALADAGVRHRHRQPPRPRRRHDVPRTLRRGHRRLRSLRPHRVEIGAPASADALATEPISGFQK